MFCCWPSVRLVTNSLIGIWMLLWPVTAAVWGVFAVSRQSVILMLYILISSQCDSWCRRRLVSNEWMKSRGASHCDWPLFSQTDRLMLTTLCPLIPLTLAFCCRMLSTASNHSLVCESGAGSSDPAASADAASFTDSRPLDPNVQLYDFHDCGTGLYVDRDECSDSSGHNDRSKNFPSRVQRLEWKCDHQVTHHFAHVCHLLLLDAYPCGCHDYGSDSSFYSVSFFLSFSASRFFTRKGSRVKEERKRHVITCVILVLFSLLLPDTLFAFQWLESSISTLWSPNLTLCSNSLTDFFWSHLFSIRHLLKSSFLFHIYFTVWPSYFSWHTSW